MTSPMHPKGFTVIELLMVMLLVGILAVVAVDVVSDTTSESRFEETVNRLKQIQNAMIGDPNLKEGGARTSFGYLGDVGGIPTAGQGLAALTTNPGVPVAGYAINSTVRFGIGWNGPYLSGGNSGTDYTTDLWGNALVYSPAAVPPTVVSRGSDGAAGGTGFAQDITVSMPVELRVATVRGFICVNGAPFTASAEVQLNYPNGSGVLTQTTDAVIPAENGQFSFANVPMGIRSITVYIPSIAAPTQTIGPVVITVDKPNFLVPCSQVDTG